MALYLSSLEADSLCLEGIRGDKGFCFLCCVYFVRLDFLSLGWEYLTGRSRFGGMAVTPAGVDGYPARQNCS